MILYLSGAKNAKGKKSTENEKIPWGPSLPCFGVDKIVLYVHLRDKRVLKHQGRDWSLHTRKPENQLGGLEEGTKKRGGTK